MLTTETVSSGPCLCQQTALVVAKLPTWHVLQQYLYLLLYRMYRKWECGENVSYCNSELASTVMSVQHHRYQNIARD